MTAELLLKPVDLVIPVHLAIIMDGNGRWAAARGLPRIAGHNQGAEAVRAAIKGAVNHGIRYLTLYSFSSENWKRPTDEVDGLMGLLRFYLRNEIVELDRQGVRVRVIGQRSDLSKDIVNLINGCEELTAKNTTLDLIIALSYGSRVEIVNAAKFIAQEVSAKKIYIDDVGEATFEKYLETYGVPDPDLLIRTSGEKRISNFLLWQLAYTEFIFLDTLWPDFNEKILTEALTEFSHRERRYGATN
jgi:undecaprenyl diphosphate synthase